MEEKSELRRLTRLTAILLMLQSKKVTSAAQLAEKFNVSKRTIYRDIRALEQAGTPITVEEGSGYTLVDGYHLPPIMFSEYEANALITAEKLVASTKDDSLIYHHTKAVNKIKAVLKFANKDKANLLSERVAVLRNLKREITSHNLSDIQWTITNLRLIEIKYLSLNKNETTSRLIEPQALYHSQENWILIAWCRLRKQYRQFRLDQILTFEITQQEFVSRNFDLMSYFMSFS